MTQKPTILIVDDDPLIRGMLADALDENYNVLLAGDGVDAAYLYESNLEHIAAIVTDLEMPRLGGQSLAQWVHHIRPHLPVIIMSGSFQKDALRDLPRRPMTSFLGKPFEAAQLQEMLELVLEPSGQPA
jgi:DNA-binding NtrC family response regulator